MRSSSIRLAPQLTREFIAQLVATWRDSGQLLKPVDDAQIDRLTETFSKRFGPILAAAPAQEDVNELIRQIAAALGQGQSRRSARIRIS